MPGLIMAVASNDQGRIYFNGVDIYAVTEARPLMLDADKGKVTLKAGRQCHRVQSHQRTEQLAGSHALSG